MDDQNPPTSPTSPVQSQPIQDSNLSQSQPVQPAPSTPPKSFLSKWALLILFVLILILAVGGTYLVLDSKPKPQTVISKTIPTSVPTPTPDETVTWKIYTNTKVGYQIKFPNRYSEPSERNTSPPVPATGTEDETRIVFGDTQSDFYFLSVFPFSGTIEELRRTRKKDYGYPPLGGWEDSKDIATEEQTLHTNNIEGLFVTATYTNPALRLTGYSGRSVFFLGKNRAFVLYGWSSHSKDELPQVFSTFKFTQ